MTQTRYPQSRVRTLEQKLAAYSAAAGASLLVAANVDAQPVYTDVVPDQSISTLFHIDFNNDATFDATIIATYGSTNLASQNGKVGAVFSSVLTPIRLSPLASPAIPVSGIHGVAGCAYGVPVVPTTCTYQTLNCTILVPAPGKAQLFPGFPITVPHGTDPFFIKVGGGLDPAALAKTQPPAFWEGWIRVQRVMAGTAVGKSAVPSHFVVKDYAYFPSESAHCDVSALPVELVSFDAQIDDGAIRLTWETASETDNAGFEVQYRPLDMEAFSPLAFVEGAGTTTGPTRYSHRADNLLPGKYVFRLRQIDLDGTFAYSHEIEARIEVPGTHFLSDAYPNPFNPQAQFSLVVPREQSVRVELFDAAGRSISVLHDGVVAADTPTRFAISADDLPSGTYLYRVTGETFSETKRVVMTK